MKLRKHRRAASKIAAKSAAKRKAAGPGNADTRTAQKRETSRRIRYRVEIWRADEPEFRLTSFPMEYESGSYKARDVALDIAAKVFNWIDSKLPPEHRSNFDASVPAGLWNAEPAANSGIPIPRKPGPKIADADIPF